MSTATLPNQKILPVDRLSLTLTLALLLHALVVLGVTFIAEEKPKPRFDTMEIVLVQQTSKAPSEAELLAQSNLEGGGDETEDEISALPAPFPAEQATISGGGTIAEPKPPTEATNELAPSATHEATPTSDSSNTPNDVSAPTDTPTTAKEPNTPLTAEESEISTPVPSESTPEESAEAKQTTKQATLPVAPSTASLLANSFKVASLSADIRRKLENKAKRPRRKFVSANTKEHDYAAYMHAWRKKVERIGNLNYPAAARKKNLSGKLVLDVSLNKDGSINEITIRRSSGHQILDQSAIKIVKLSAPFAPFPKKIKQQTDILHIIRTWQFTTDNKYR